MNLMSSNIVQRFNIQIAGEPIAFAQPFSPPVLDLEEPPARYTVVIDADATTSLWAGAPLTTTFDVLAIVSDQDLDVKFTVGSSASFFTLFVRGGGYPLMLQGD